VSDWKEKYREVVAQTGRAVLPHEAFVNPDWSPGPDHSAPLPDRCFKALLVGGFYLGHAFRHMGLALEKIGGEVRHCPYMGEFAQPHLLREAIEEFQPQVILAVWWRVEQEEAIKAIRDSRAVKVYWSLDDPCTILSHPGIVAQSAAPWDVVLTSDDSEYTRNFYHRWLRKRLYWVPAIYPDDIRFDARPDLLEKYSADVMLMGSAYKRNRGKTTLFGRDEMAQACEDAGLPLRLYGEEWEKVGRTAERTEWEEQFFAYRAAKITLASQVESCGCHYFSDRMVHSTGSGAFVLCDRVGQIGEVWREDEEVAYWSTLQELTSKAAWWLAHDEERQAAARRAQERTLRLFSLERMATLMREVIAGGGPTARLYDLANGPAQCVIRGKGD